VSTSSADHLGTLMGRSAPGRALGFVGIALVAVSIGAAHASAPLWALVAAGVALAAWAAAEVVPARSPLVVRIGLLAAVLLGSGIAALPTSIIGLVPALIAVITTIGRTAVPLAAGVVGAAGCAAVVALVGTASGEPPTLVAVAFTALLIAVLSGLTRRQSHATADRDRQLAAEHLAMQTERARSAALDERARIARDLHDTLAHALGGLVVQLDAVEALTEAGRIDDVLTRVRAARGLAADGLADARRAVDALREPPSGTVSVSELVHSIRRSVEAEQALGTNLTVTVPAEREAGAVHVTAAASDALMRLVQEALTNARKHAGGRPVDLRVDLQSRRLVVTVVNGRTAQPAGDLASTGSGRGVRGMRERFDQLPGATLTIGDDPERFTIAAEVGLA